MGASWEEEATADQERRLRSKKPRASHRFDLEFLKAVVGTNLPL